MLFFINKEDHLSSKSLSSTTTSNDSFGIIDIDRNNNSILCKEKFEYETDLAKKIRELELEKKH
jgi:hypothetical protein